MPVLCEIAVVIGVLLGMIGLFFNLLPLPDDRFDDYSAARRATSKRAGPSFWRVGLGLIVLAGICALL